MADSLAQYRECFTCAGGCVPGAKLLVNLLLDGHLSVGTAWHAFVAVYLTAQPFAC